MFIEPTITWVPSGFSGYIWLDTKIVLKKNTFLTSIIVVFAVYYLVDKTVNSFHSPLLTCSMIFVVNSKRTCLCLIREN